MKALVFLLLATLVGVAACGRGAEPNSVAATATPLPTATAVLPTPSPTAKIDDAPSSAVAGTASSHSLLSGDTIATFQEFLSSLVYHPGDPPPRKAVGAILLIDTPEGRFLEAAGVADLATGRPLTTNDRFEIGSITKVFTAVLLLQLHEEGVLSLDDTLATWLPELAGRIPYSQEMTLRQLASHTAGLDDYERNLYPMPDILVDSNALERGYTPDELASWIAENKEPLFSPGTPGQWRYSSAGYVLLALVLEAATGESLGGLYHSRIFDPLGLESAILLHGVPEAGQIVNGYNAMQGEYVDVTRWNASGVWAAGALAMNASDLAEFAAALSDGQLFQAPTTLDAMIDFVKTGQDRGFTGYGLGLAELAGGAWGHAGGTPGFAAQLIIMPKEGVVGVYMANSGSASMNPEEMTSLMGK